MSSLRLNFVEGLKIWVSREAYVRKQLSATEGFLRLRLGRLAIFLYLLTVRLC
ncbi:MAG: hypothetical protein QXL29_03025 [Zestosphaera sp.]